MFSGSVKGKGEALGFRWLWNSMGCGLKIKPEITKWGVLSLSLHVQGIVCPLATSSLSPTAPTPQSFAQQEANTGTTQRSQ